MPELANNLIKDITFRQWLAGSIMAEQWYDPCSTVTLENQRNRHAEEAVARADALIAALEPSE